MLFHPLIHIQCGLPASMRPGRIRPGNRFSLRFRPPRCNRFNEAGANPPRKFRGIIDATIAFTVASMRPGRIRPGNRWVTYARSPQRVGFNEAGANPPRKSESSCPPTRARTRFNEAGANPPRKSSVAVIVAAQLETRFNEAGANPPRK